MLAIADRHGEVEASVPGLADLSRVTLEQCQDALRVLSSPDEFSRNQDFEGRRIAEIPGGWELLNHDLYRSKLDDEEQREKDRERKARQRAELKANCKNVPECPSVSHDVPPCHAESDKQLQIPSPDPSSSSGDLKEDPTQEVGSVGQPEPARLSTPPSGFFDSVIGYLNERTGKSFDPKNAVTRKHIRARWREGHDLDAFKKVIDCKVAKWSTVPDLCDYLRPQTLFGTKFESYLNETGPDTRLSPLGWKAKTILENMEFPETKEKP